MLLSQLPVGTIESLVACRNHYAVGTRDGIIRLGEISPDGTPRQLDLQHGRKWAAHQGRIYDLRFSSDGSTLFSIGSDGCLRAWQVNEKDGNVAIYLLRQR